MADRQQASSHPLPRREGTGVWGWTSRVGWCLAACLVLAWQANAEPGFLRLTDLAAGTEWIAWQEGGLLQLPAPAGWRIEGTPEDPLTVQLAGGELVTLPPNTPLRAEGTPMLGFQAGWARLTHSRGALEATVTTRRIMLQGGALMYADHESFGSAGQTMVTAIYIPRRREVALRYEAPLMCRIGRLELLCPAEEPATVDGLRLPLPAGTAAPATVRRVGLWSPAGVQVQAGPHDLTAQTEQVAWAELDGQVLRTEPVRLQAPKADVAIRRATLRGVSRRALPCRLVEPSGLMAEHLRLEVSGAPSVVAFAAADSVEGLEQAFDTIAVQRSGGPGRDVDPLIEAVREYLLPLWFGLWYDDATGREVPRSPATLRTFYETYRDAVRASEADLRKWLDERAEDVSLAEPEAFQAALGELVDYTAREDRKAAVWWSIYLSDLLSELAGAAVYYWQPEATLQSAAADPGEVTMDGLAKLAGRRQTGLLRACDEAMRSGQRVDALVFPRLAPNARLSVEVMLEVGRKTPVGTYQAEMVLSGAGDERVPLTVRVKPSYGEIGLLALVVLLPAALAVGAGLGMRRRTGRAADA